MGTIEQASTDVDVTEVNSTLKQLIETVTQLSNGQERQNNKIDVLTRVVSQLKGTVERYFHNGKNTTTLSSSREASSTNNQTVLSNNFVENETLNEEASFIIGIENDNNDENQNDARQLLQDLQNDEDEREDLDGNENVSSNKDNDSNNNNNDIRMNLPTFIDDSAGMLLNDNNDSIEHDESLGLAQQEMGNDSQDIVQQQDLQNDEMEEDLRAQTKANESNVDHNNVPRATASRVLSDDSETDFESSPLKTKTPTPKVLVSNGEEDEPPPSKSSVHSFCESNADMFDDSKSKSTTSPMSRKNKQDVAQNKGRKLLYESSEDSSFDESDEFFNDFKENKRKNYANSRVMNNDAAVLGKREKLVDSNLDSDNDDGSGKRISNKQNNIKKIAGMDKGVTARNVDRKRQVLTTSDSDESDSESLCSKYRLGEKKKPVVSNIAKNKRSNIDESDSDDDSRSNQCQTNNVFWKRDPKLHPKAPRVLMERLPEVILDRLYTFKFITIINDDDCRKQGKKGRDKDPLLRAIKQLCKFEALISDAPRKNKGTSSTSHKKDARKKVEKDRLRTDETSSDESVETAVVKRKPLFCIPVDDLKEDRVGSSDEDLDAPVVDSDSDSSAAKRKVLKQCRNLPELKPSGVSKPDKIRKLSGGKYYTPKCVRLPSDSDSDASEEHSDDDDFVSVKKVTHINKVKTYVVDSDGDSDDTSVRSQQIDESNHNSGKSIEEVALSSDDSSSKKRKSKSRSKRGHPSDSDSDLQKKDKKQKKRKIQSDDGVKETELKTEKLPIIIDNESDSDIQVVANEEAPASQGKGRINIRPILSKKELQKETRAAQEEEQKRKERVADRQRLFNSFQPLDLAVTDAVVENLVLDIDKTTKEPSISVDPIIVRKLKPHQAKGIKFLWDSCFESLEQYKTPNNEGSGCILAHCMGLGKTLQTVGFLHCVMTSDLLEMRSTLVICPLNTVTNWSNEIKLWLRDVSVKVPVHKLYEGKNVEERVQALETWQRRGGIGIMHYERFRELVGDGKQIKSKKAKEKEVYQPRINKCLLDPGPDIVICDEAHMIKNNKSKVSLTINQIRTKRRILLTGTPLQNNLLEYHTMMQFVKPNLLGSLKEFRNRFVNPITNGQCMDSDERDVRIMKRRAHVLHKLLDGCVQRLDYSILVPYLPPKYEYVLLIKLTDLQKKIYKHFVDSIMQGGDESIAKRIKRKFLSDGTALSKVISHPYSLTLGHNENNDNISEAGSLKDFIDYGSDVSVLTDQDSDVDWLNEDWEVISKTKSKPQVKKEIGDTSTTVPINVDQAPAINEVQQAKLNFKVIEEGGDWWSQFLGSKDDISALEHSSKIVLLFEILKTCESIGDKVLVFSQSVKSLNIIERFLEDLDKEGRIKFNNNQATFPPTTSGDNFRWRKNKEYYRIDGSTKTEDRQRNCDNFNKTDFNRAKLFLISTKAGGLGINLVGANRVVIFDASWNPSQDLQSIFRVFRFGQTKPCYVYRLVAQGTMEEKIYNRQIVKLSLSGRVIDEHQIGRHFAFDSIAKIYEYDFEEKPDRPTPAVPKDILLADLLISHQHILDSFLEHDSLLVNQTDEGLTEEERLAAWYEYQTEKDTRPKSNIHQTADSQQANIKIKAKIRELYPHLTEDELQSYFLKVHTDMLELGDLTREIHSYATQRSEAEEARMQSQREERKTLISRYFTERNFLGNIMTRLGVQRSQPVLSTPSSDIPQGGGIRLAPMSNILEPSFIQNMTDMGSQNQQTNLNRTTPNDNRGRLPTTTVPYNNNLAASSRFPPAVVNSHNKEN